MTDYLRKRFPLAGTSTVYMSGKSVYNLVRHDKPGIIASIELLPGDATAFEDAVRSALADAWDQGMAYGVNYDAGDYEVAPEPIENPYRRSEVPEPQGEPTDMQVTVALQEFYGDSSSTDFDRATEDSMRAALRAAAAVRGEGR